ncbi:MAG: glycosyltransferase family 2 protein [bacterium]|nr:glycosyltransferase family 2 protein [bacterium]
MNSPLVSIIIVTYNSSNIIKKCLDSVLNTSYKNKEIIVVDNNSPNGIDKILGKYKEKIKVLFEKQNLGYSGGNNLGIKNSKGKYVFLLNPDTEVTEGFLQPLVEKMESDDKVAACQPLVYLLNDKNKINLTGKETNFLGFDWIRDYLGKDISLGGEITSFSGCGVMLRKSVFLKTKAFDSNYFMYYEDSDLSWRLRLFGFKLIFVPEAVMYHDYKYLPIESYQTLKNKLFFNERNRLMTIYKNYNTKTIILLLPATVVLEFCMLIFSIFGGWFNEKLRGYVSIIKLLKVLNQNRTLIQKNRLLSDKQVINDFKSTLSVEIYDNWGVRLFINPFLYCYWKVAKHLI